MPLFASIVGEAARRNLRFLVIGGHAVAHHGYLRTTEDADILVAREDRGHWLELAGQVGLTLFHDGGTFLQFKPAETAGWRLDVMLVNANTFAKMAACAGQGRLEDQPVLMPALDHLLALKLHALKHAKGIRVLKDFDDVVNLIVNNRIDVRAPSFQELVLKYGTNELYDKLVHACAE